MAETRTFEPGDPEGLQKLVREALGETTRPFQPGEETSRSEQAEPEHAEQPQQPGADEIAIAKAGEIPDAWWSGGGAGGGGGGAW